MIKIMTRKCIYYIFLGVIVVLLLPLVPFYILGRWADNEAKKENG